MSNVDDTLASIDDVLGAGDTAILGDPSVSFDAMRSRPAHEGDEEYDPRPRPTTEVTLSITMRRLTTWLRLRRACTPPSRRRGRVIDGPYGTRWVTTFTTSRENHER